MGRAASRSAAPRRRRDAPQQNRLLSAGAPVVPHDEVPLSGLSRRDENFHIGVREARGAKARRHGLGRLGDRTHGIDRIDRDQLTIDLASGALMWRERSLRDRGLRGENDDKEELATHALNSCG